MTVDLQHFISTIRRRSKRCAKCNEAAARGTARRCPAPSAITPGGCFVRRSRIEAKSKTRPCSNDEAGRG
ncbi:MAG: hypothetical protein AAGG54_16315, partial [Pseudomonadota bacterium]